MGVVCAACAFASFTLARCGKPRYAIIAVGILCMLGWLSNSLFVIGIALKPLILNRSL